MLGSTCCHLCNDEARLALTGMDLLRTIYFIVCKDCGNKRCPKATDHRLQCTGSNALGQEGSLYRLPASSEARLAKIFQKARGES
jgi:hypothetical protein